MCSIFICCTFSQVMLPVSWQPWALYELTPRAQTFPCTVVIKITNMTVEPLYVITRNPHAIVEEYPLDIQPGTTLEYTVDLLSRERATRQLIMICFSPDLLYEFAQDFISTALNLTQLAKSNRIPIAILRPKKHATPRKPAEIVIRDFDLDDQLTWKIL